MRLAKEAIDVRDRLRSQKTVPDFVPRKTWSLPPDVDQQTFDKALAELKQVLGRENVELNEGPLLDGWYMQHPYVTISQPPSCNLTRTATPMTLTTSLTKRR